MQVRAGAIRRWYFAHKHLEACKYGQESPSLLEARALLYQWLQRKWGEQVTLEYQVEGVDLPHPIDCWVTGTSGNIAYWIIDASIRAQKRDFLLRTLAGVEAFIHWVFLTDMLRVDPGTPDLLNLTTTERDFIQQSAYDEPINQGRFGQGGSLHYLDRHKQVLTTYRGLHLIHPPAGYEGHREQHQLMEMLSSKTGEFVHPGEHERLQALRVAQRTAERERQVAAQREAERLETLHRQLIVERSKNTGLDALGTRISSSSEQLSLTKATFVARPVALPPTCVTCGERTDEWWWRDGATNTCECRRCWKQRRSS